MNITAISASIHAMNSNASSSQTIDPSHAVATGEANVAAKRKNTADSPRKLNPLSALCLHFAYSASAIARRNPIPKLSVTGSNIAICIYLIPIDV